METIKRMPRSNSTLLKVKACAKALYLLGGLEQMQMYLDGVSERNPYSFHEGICNMIVEKVTEECASMTVAEIENLCKPFVKRG